MSSRTGPQHLGKYELREKLGHGGVAEVWKAFDTELHRYVALKLLHANLRTDPEFVTRFTREALFIAALHHPNIVQIYDFQTSHTLEADTPIAYMVMDYVEGETLARYIYRTSHVGKFPAPADIVQLFASISKALDYAHQEGMIHRDIKPANILLDKRHTAPNSIGEPVLTDFGIARIMGASSDTMTGMWLGTPLYISPEQAQGYPVTKQSDIYSLGIILYEICTGVCPFRGETFPAIMLQHVSAAPPSPALFNPAIPPALTAVILHAIAKNPAERFSSASALTAAIAEAFHLPLPAGLFLPGYASNPLMQATQLRLDQSGRSAPLVQQGEQWSQPLPVMDSLTQTPPSDLKAQQLMESPPSGAGFPSTPIKSTPLFPSLSSAEHNAQTVVDPSPVPAIRFSPVLRTVGSWRAWRWKLIVWFVVLLVLVSSSIVALNALYNVYASHEPDPIKNSKVVGTLTFTDSGQYDPNTTVGYNDIVTLSLHSLTPPQTGMAYFVWLMPDQGDDGVVSLLLGRLSVNVGNATLEYTSPTHKNLLGEYSGVRITEQSANGDPSIPSLDPQAWRWDGWVPYAPTPRDPNQFSLLSHVRHMLAKDPTLQANNLPGGLIIWTTRNTAKVEEWSSAARGSWKSGMSDGDADLIHKNLIRILDYLDGYSYVQQEVPNGSEWLVDSLAGKFGLLSYTQDQQPPGYLQHLDTHLRGVVASPGHMEEQEKIVVQVDGVVTRMIEDLTKVRKDAAQLVRLSNAELHQPNTLTLLNEIASLTKEVKSGWFDSTTNQNLGGVIWLSAQLHQLGTISLQASN